MKKNASIKQQGFTLIEAMVAISVLSLAITGPMIIAQKGIASAVYARDQITASYLAQEAVEYIRNARDTNRINNALWILNSTSTLSTCLDTGVGQRCEIDPYYADFTNVSAIKSCPSGVCNRLYFDTVNNLYRPSATPVGGWKLTPFTRTIAIDGRASNKEVMISVEVSWVTNLFSPPRKFSIKEYLFDF